MIKTVQIMEIDNVRMIVVDNEAFDWGLDEDSVQAAQIIIKNDPEVKEGWIGNIQKHFVACFSEFLGRDITLREINESIERGYVEV